MNSKDFLSISDLSDKEITDIVRQAERTKLGTTPNTLNSKIVALIFEKPSLRTRVSFEVGIQQLGGQCIYLSKDDIGLGVREPEADVARVLDRWVDMIVARVFSHRSLEQLANHCKIPVINALSDLEHPCQAIADILTIKEHKGTLEGLKLAFIGDGNNVASSLALACASVGMAFCLASPINYQIPSILWEKAKLRAKSNNTEIGWVSSPQEAVRDADVVYTDVWVSMGQDSETIERLEAFKDYQVDPKLLAVAKTDVIFMHDLPAHEGQEIAPGMLDHPKSVVFNQSENRLHAQKAVLSKLSLCND